MQGVIPILDQSTPLLVYTLDSGIKSAKLNCVTKRWSIMGFFSWITSDTFESVTNKYTDIGTFPVYVLFPDGTKIREDAYEGYGVFGGQDVYALVARWNVPDECTGDVDHDRQIGIDLACYDEDHAKLKYPIKIVRSAMLGYEDVPYSKSCPDQGYFYPWDEEEWEEN